MATALKNNPRFWRILALFGESANHLVHDITWIISAEHRSLRNRRQRKVWAGKAEPEEQGLIGTMRPAVLG
jgi:hypothetical protein